MLELGCRMAEAAPATLSLSARRLPAVAPVPAAVGVVRSNVCVCVCSLPGLYIEGEGVAFKNNVFGT